MPLNEIPQVRRLMANDARIGMGFNSESGLAVGTPFKIDEVVVEADPDAPGQDVFSTITLVNSHDELMESLGLDIRAQGRYGFFLGGREGWARRDLPLQLDVDLPRCEGHRREPLRWGAASPHRHG